MYVEKEARSINKINDDIKSAGQSFLGLHMADLLTRIKELDDKVSKSKLIEEYHSNQQGYYDKDTGGTRTRVNAAIRIIKAEKVMYALEQIDGSDPRVLPEAANKAKETIMKIHTGELKLPNLDSTSKPPIW
jgi:hypothetical protein